MKKILTTIALSTLLFSCKQEMKVETNKNYSEIYNSKELLELRNTITDSVEKLKFYQHLYQVSVFEDLKNYKSEKDTILVDEATNAEFLNLKDNPDNVLIDISKIVVSEYTQPVGIKNFNSGDETSSYKPKEIINRLDSIFMTKKYDLGSVLHETFVGTLMYGTCVSSYKNNIVTVRRDFGTGSSLGSQYAIIENNKVTNLKGCYDYLDKIEFQKLVKEIKDNTGKTFASAAYHEETEIRKLEDKNYLISFNGYTEDDASCCPSLYIIYETSDFKKIVPNSIKALNR